jgi:hypothetical protein
MSESENYIKGLAFSGAHAISGDGMAPVITNGRKAAKTLLDMMARRASKMKVKSFLKMSAARIASPNAGRRSLRTPVPKRISPTRSTRWRKSSIPIPSKSK